MKETIELHVESSSSFLKKTIGLLGKQKAKSISIRTRWGIHTFFLKFPIDVLVLDKESKITSIKKNLRPNTVFFWNPKYAHVIELPCGTISEKKLQVGTFVTLVWD